MKRNLLSLPSVCSAIASLFISAFIPPLAAQELTVTDGLQLWLKADAGTTVSNGQVTQWDDQSGNLNNAAAISDINGPTLVPAALNGKPVLHFDGVDDYLEIPDSDSISIAGDITTFFVVRFDDFATYRAVWAKTFNNQPAPNDWYVQPTNSVPLVYRGNGFDPPAAVPGGLALTAGSYLTVGWGAEGTHITHYLGDQPTGGGDIFPFIGDANTPLVIGSRQDLVTKMKGDIAEIVIYNRSLTPAERSSVVAYLGAKYNIANLAPTVSIGGTPNTDPVAPGTVVSVDANAVDPDGTVVKVEFALNGAVIARATAAPFSVHVNLATPGTYNFTARAFDNRSAIADSAMRTYTVNPSGTTPQMDVTQNLQLWLKADVGVTTGAGSSVSNWADQSGNGNNATSFDPNVAPTLVPDGLDGRASIRFDGFDDYLEIPSSPSIAISGDITTFWVARLDDTASYRVIWAKTLNNIAAPTDWWTKDNEVYFWRGNGTVYGNVRATTPLTPGIAQIAGFSMAGTTATHYLNGLPNGTAPINAQVVDAGSPLMIGTRADFVTRMKGDIAEILIYNTALSSADRSAVQAYLAVKYGVVAPIGSVVNTAPAASLASDPNEDTLPAGSMLSLNATAEDADGSVVKVEYYLNGNLIGTATEAPFSLQVNLATAGTYNFLVRATDNLGAVADSAVLTRTATSSNPALIVPNGLRLWLKADAGVSIATGTSVSNWLDQSGNGNDAAQFDPNQEPQLVENAMNGRPVLRFDGLDDYLEIPFTNSLAISGDITSFFVVKFDDFDTYRVVWSKSNFNGFAAPTDWWALGDQVHFYRGDGTSFGEVAGTNPILAGVPQVAGFMMSGQSVTHYLNGRANGSGVITLPVADIGLPLRIGTRMDLVTRMKGDIAEILIFDRALTPTELNDVQIYLAGRYGIPLLTLPTPALSISQSGDDITVSWPGGYPGWILETTSDLLLPWEPIPGVMGHTHTEPITSKRFYRLRY